MTQEFYIKHKSSEKYLHPYTGKTEPGYHTPVVFSRNKHDFMVWKFEIVDDYWGYICHAKSKYIIHPYTGSLSPAEETPLVLSVDRHDGALFAYDAVNQMIVHKGGLKVHPHGDRPDPVDHEKAVLCSSENGAMKFLLVQPDTVNGLQIEVPVYDKPKVVGSWKIINSVLTPKAQHTYTIQLHIGEIKENNIEASISQSWQANLGKDLGLFDFDNNTTKSMMEKACFSTWSKEFITTKTITVIEEKQSVTWQYYFEVNQFNRKRIFRSNVFADTSKQTDRPLLDQNPDNATQINQIGHEL